MERTHASKASSEAEPSPLLRLFVARGGVAAGATPEETMSNMVARLRRSCASAKNFDQRLQLMLRRRRVKSVQVIDSLENDGALEPLGNDFAAGFRMFVKGSVILERRRFTMAHEVCHTFVYELVPEVKFGPHSTDPQEERLCDFGASELLMPRMSLRKRTRALPVSLESLEVLAWEYNVSLAAMFVRLRELGLWRCQLSEWHRMVNGAFALRRMYGGRAKQWEWDDASILSEAWRGSKLGAGHTLIYYDDERGVRFYRPTMYQAKRFGRTVFALWGPEIEGRFDDLPLLGGGTKRR